MVNRGYPNLAPCELPGVRPLQAYRPGKLQGCRGDGRIEKTNKMMASRLGEHGMAHF